MQYVTIEVTQGNINNNHLYLSSVIDFFPASAIGGSNKDTEAELKIEIHCGIDMPVFTDIAGDKKIFRKRAWVGEFFKAHAIKGGDKVIIAHTDGNRYHLYPSQK